MKNIAPIVIFILLFFAFDSYSQDLVVNNVSPKMRKFRGVQSIEDLGYYCFVEDEKSKKGFKLFNLYIWDYDLNEIATNKLELEKKSISIDAVFNGKNFLSVFYDSKKDNVRAISYNSKGEVVAEKLVDGIKTKFMMLEEYQPSYYAAGENGFYAIIPDKEQKFGFRISRYDNDLKELWKTEFFPPKGVQVIIDAKSDDNKLVVLKYSKGSKMSKRAEIDVTAFDGKTGKELWTHDLSLGVKTMLPTEIEINSKGNIAIAGMYFDGDKIGGMNSDGIFFTHLDGSGKQLASVSKAWEGELQTFLREAKNSLTMGKTKVIFEDVEYNESTDEFKLVGELFTVGTAGRVLAALNNDPNAETKITIEDLVVFTFTGDGQMRDFYAVNKARSNIYIPSTYAGGLKIASYLKSTGSLPFKFVSPNRDGDAIAYYIDFLKTDDNGNLTSAKLAGFNAGKIGIAALNLNRSSINKAELTYLPLSKKAADKDQDSDVEFDSKRSIITATESKPGYILISELSKKTGDLKLFLEEVGK